jgi:hypothetical protein
MPFRVTGLSADPFRHLYGLSDRELAEHGAIRYRADVKPGFPDRIELTDLEPGETAILVNHMHQAVATPYRASHAVFVREGAETPRETVDEVPQSLRVRLLSLRAFDAADMMIDAEIIDGAEAKGAIERLLANSAIAYIHAHYAKRGCYAARIERA